MFGRSAAAASPALVSRGLGIASTPKEAGPARVAPDHGRPRPPLLFDWFDASTRRRGYAGGELGCRAIRARERDAERSGRQRDRRAGQGAPEADRRSVQPAPATDG